MRQAVTQTMGPSSRSEMEEVGRQNMAMMERAMSLFAPFAPRAAGSAEPNEGTPAAGDEVEALRAEVAYLRAQLAAKPTTSAAEPIPLTKKAAAGDD